MAQLYLGDGWHICTVYSGTASFRAGKVGYGRYSRIAFTQTIQLRFDCVSSLALFLPYTAAPIAAITSLFNSVSWLVANGRYNEADVVVRQLIDGSGVPSSVTASLRWDFKPDKEDALKDANAEAEAAADQLEKQYSAISMFSYASVRGRLLVMCATWTAATGCYYGLTFL
jgi:hypothetical protein